MHPLPRSGREKSDQVLQFNGLPSSKGLDIIMILTIHGIFGDNRVTTMDRSRQERLYESWIEMPFKDPVTWCGKSSQSSMPVSSFPGPVIRSSTSLRLTPKPKALSSFRHESHRSRLLQYLHPSLDWMAFSLPSHSCLRITNALPPPSAF